MVPYIIYSYKNIIV